MNKGKLFYSFLLILSLSVIPVIGQEAASFEITAVRVEKGTDQTQIFLDYTQDLQYEVFLLLNPNRLVLDFHNNTKIASTEPVTVGSHGIKALRCGYPTPDVLRVAIDLEDQVPDYKLNKVDSGLSITFTREVEAAAEKIEEEPVEIKVKPVSQAATTQISTADAEKLKEATEILKPDLRPHGLGIVTGVFSFKDENIKSLYGNSTSFFGGEYSLVLPIPVSYIDACFGFSTYSIDGKTTFFEEDIKLQVMTMSLAIRYLGKFGRFSPYIGPGIDYFIFKETYPADFPIDSMNGTDLGFHFQAGTYVHIFDFVSVKLHLKYNMFTSEANDVPIDFGGFEYGLGLTFRFGK
ncbi:AMIN domain-containing protein [Acidobacteriota bacterium]